MVTPCRNALYEKHCAKQDVFGVQIFCDTRKASNSRQTERYKDFSS